MNLSGNNQEKIALSEYENEKAQEFAKQLMEAYTREFVFLLMGRTGVGKSSTINQLMGYEFAPVGDFEPMTSRVEEYRLPISNVKFLIVDTPGLCDDLEEKGNDMEYIKLIKGKVKYIDSLLYVTPLSDKRIRPDELRGIKIITDAFGEKVWKNSVIVFTFSDQVNIDDFERTISERSRLMKKSIQRFVSRDISEDIKFVATSNESKVTPDGQEWLGEFYTTVAKRISQEGFIQYLMATTPDIIVENIEKSPLQNVSQISSISPRSEYRNRSPQVTINNVILSPEKHLNERQAKDLKNRLDIMYPEPVRAEGMSIASKAIKAVADVAKKIFNKIKSWF